MNFLESLKIKLKITHNIILSNKSSNKISKHDFSIIFDSLSYNYSNFIKK